MASRRGAHALAICAFGAITAAWLYPLLLRFDTHLPGPGAGDNVTFLWNVWWMRQVLEQPGLSFFHTPFLLHPFGANLTLHTHTALPSLVAALAEPLSLIAAQNAVVVGHLFLNFVCAYALAFQVTRRAAASSLAAVVFGWSPYISAHLVGHFNLIAAWVVPLACSMLLIARASNRASHGVLLGGAIAASAYVDYYLFIFVVVLTLLSVASSSVQLSVVPVVLTRRRAGIATMLVAAALAGMAFMAVVRLLGVEVVHLGGARVTLRQMRNPVTAAWLLAIGAAIARWFPPLRVRVRPSGERMGGAVLLATAVTIAAILFPLAAGTAAMWRAGDYATQVYRPRSAPGGVDAITFVLGNPFSAFRGDAVASRYTAWGIDAVEGCGWIPALALALTFAAATARPMPPAVRFWIVAGGVFLIWALGPWLLLLGEQTPLLLPQFAARYLPIVSNARIPGRSIVVVHLAVALLAALGFSRLSSQGGSRRAAAWILFAGAIIELAPARPTLYQPAVAPVYNAIRDAIGRGAVCELPLGMRDGFGHIGQFDSRHLLNQTVHRRPIVGGFVARLPPQIESRYRELPVIGTLWALSDRRGPGVGGPPPTDPGSAARALAAQGVRFLVLNRDLASPELSAFVERGIASRELARDDHRTVYEIDSEVAAWNRTAGVPARRAAEAAEQVQQQVGVGVSAAFRQVRRGYQQPRP